MARRLRVVVVIEELGRGGAERQVHELVRNLDRGSFDPVVVVLRPGGHYQDLIERAGVPVVVPRGRALRRALAPAGIASVIRDRRADIVHAFLFPAGWRAALGARIAGGRPTIYAVRSTGTWMNRRHRMMDRWVVKHVSLVVANAPAVRSDLLRRTGVEADRVRVIVNGVDTAAFHPGDSALRASWTGDGAGQSPLVGFVGSLRGAKDPIQFVRIAGAVARAHPEARFVMVGDGDLRRRVEAEIDRLHLGTRVLLAGDRSDAPDVFRALDVLVVTSEREGCCNAILEAMATGVPVVATAVGGNPDIVRHGETGLLFPYGDVAAGAACIQSLVIDGGRAAGFGTAAVETARREFSIEAMVGRTVALYRELA